MILHLNRQPIINNLEIELNQNAINVFLGPNGSGKSTCLRLIYLELLKKAPIDLIIFGLYNRFPIGHIIASINVKMQGIIAILKNKNIDPGEFLKTIQLTGNQLQYTEYCNGLGLSNIESEEIEASITEIGFILKELDLQYFNNRLSS